MGVSLGMLLYGRYGLSHSPCLEGRWGGQPASHAESGEVWVSRTTFAATRRIWGMLKVLTGMAEDMKRRQGS